MITPIHDNATLDDEMLNLMISQHRSQVRPALERLWAYYRNELDFDATNEHRQYNAAQQVGLPDRLTRSAEGNRREVVIENDIAWRVHTLVDFMAGKPVRVQSLADDKALAALIDRVLAVVLEANGGVSFLQDAALMGSVYGFVDLMLRADRLPAITGETNHSALGDARHGRAPSKLPSPRRALSYASRIVLETVEAPRAIPVLNENDYRALDGYMLHYTQPLNEIDHGSFMSRLVDRRGRAVGRQKTADVTEHWTADRVRVYRDGALVDERPNVLGRIPVVHIQNLPQPFFYEGLSEVEPMIPLQDELNTRMSDRANRVTFQSFKMYLGKGIENFLDKPVGPGQMWTTQNLDASIEAFGGDGPNPSEDAHINEIRDAMDKVSTVTPIAAGLLRNKAGNLTSENALRIAMMGLLARTEKKRVTYGRGLAQLCELVLHAMDVAGVLKTSPEDRRVALHWPSPIPENTTQRLKEAQLKVELGVPREQVLAELGYDQHCQTEQTV